MKTDFKILLLGGPFQQSMTEKGKKWQKDKMIMHKKKLIKHSRHWVTVKYTFIAVVLGFREVFSC